jgi:cardiolipin synthase A/B
MKRRIASPPPQTVVPLRLLADQAFSRTAGAPLLPGNQVRLLKNAEQNYPAWIEAIQSAKRSIHFESYILHDDQVGKEFAQLLAQQARQGIRVRLIYDWFGGLGSASRRFWRGLREAGVGVRCFNRPQPGSPVAWLTRDHRKMITVDGRIAFVTGLCVGQSWVGDPKRGIEPWRDTGVEITGPAVADVDNAFAQMWALIGSPLAPEDLASEGPLPAISGGTPLRVVASQPSMAGIYRLDLLIAAIARRSIWLTDAYFLGTPSYVQSLCAAARDGVDVRLLVPRTSDVPILRTLSRVGYRTLLEAGVRIFEWNGTMLHAKTSVVDARWARVGSTNLNLSSWMGNYELDVVAEDRNFAKLMEEMYLEDLGHSTEIILNPKRKVQPSEHRQRRAGRHRSDHNRKHRRRRDHTAPSARTR